jgi:hypothetical protein
MGSDTARLMGGEAVPLDGNGGLELLGREAVFAGALCEAALEDQGVGQRGAESHLAQESGCRLKECERCLGDSDHVG